MLRAVVQNGSVHFRTIQRPVGKTGKGEFWLFEKLMEDFQRSVGGLLGETDLIEKDHDADARVGFLVGSGEVPTLPNGSRRRVLGTLERHQIDVVESLSKNRNE